LAPGGGKVCGPVSLVGRVGGYGVEPPGDGGRDAEMATLTRLRAAWPEWRFVLREYEPYRWVAQRVPFGYDATATQIEAATAAGLTVVLTGATICSVLPGEYPAMRWPRMLFSWDVPDARCCGVAEDPSKAMRQLRDALAGASGRAEGVLQRVTLASNGVAEYAVLGEIARAWRTEAGRYWSMRPEDWGP
jgi:hypothetical protein